MNSFEKYEFTKVVLKPCIRGYVVETRWELPFYPDENYLKSFKDGYCMASGMNPDDIQIYVFDRREKNRLEYDEDSKCYLERDEPKTLENSSETKQLS